MPTFTPHLSKIGFVSKLNGYKGEVFLILEHIDFPKLEKIKFLFIELDGVAVPFVVENVLPKSGNAVVKLEDVNDEKYAKRLVGKPVFIEAKGKKKKTITPARDDLIGYTVIDNQHGPVGTIEKIEEYPQQLIATCLVNGKEVMIPLNENILEEVDDEKQKIFVNLPEGLLDIYLT